MHAIKHSWSNLTSCWQWTEDGFVYVLQAVDRAVETLHVVMISTGAKDEDQLLTTSLVC